jgi:hypothetical protein
MKTAACVLLPLSLLMASCSDTPPDASAGKDAVQGYDMSRLDHTVLCSSIRRVSKDAVNGFAALQAGQRALTSSKMESMSRLYREYREDETGFHMPGASDCYLTSSLDRPPGTLRWAYYRCHWPYPSLDQARSAFRDLNRHIEICMDAEDLEVRQEKDGREISRRIFRAPDASLHLYTAYFSDTSKDEPTGPPVLDLRFQASLKGP